MTSPDYGELVKEARESANSDVWVYNLLRRLADAIEQQARRIAELENYIGKKHLQIERLIQWRDAGLSKFEEARYIARLAIQERNSLRAELTRQKHVTATLMAAWPKGVPMPEWEEAAAKHGGMSGRAITQQTLKNRLTASRDLAAAHVNYRELCEELITARNELNAARRETEEMRERVIEVVSENVGDRLEALQLITAIRALSAQPDPERKSMGEILVDPKEQKFWDTADKG